MKTAELEGAALDYWVARAEGWENDRLQDKQMRKHGIVPGCHYSASYSYAIVAPTPVGGMHVGSRPHWSPSTMWHIGGPIIERERITAEPHYPSGWFATNGGADSFKGPTLLIAAMRCYIASRFGYEVPDIKETA